MMFRVGLIGCGDICNELHAPAYRRIRQTQVVALCDINPAKWKQIQKHFRHRVNLYTDYQEMIQQEQLDFVDICTPNYLHAEMAVYAMKHGLHVFVEKPDTITVNDVLKLKKVQADTGKTLMVMRNNRYRFTSRVLKRQIDHGEFGEIYAARCGWVRPRGIPEQGGWFTSRELSGGGPLMDLGVHIIDLAIYLMGNPKPRSVSGCTFTNFGNGTDEPKKSYYGEKVKNGVFDVEDLAMGFIRFDNGSCLQIEFSWVSNVASEKMFIDLRGDKKGAEWRGHTCRVFDGHGRGVVKNLVNICKQLCCIPRAHEANIRHFCNVLEKKEFPDYEIEQGVKIIKILCAMYESAYTGHEVLV